MPRSYRSESAAVDTAFARGADSLAANVRSARNRAGLTQLDLAELADISVNYLQRIERPGAPPNVTLRLLATLATSLGVGMHDLLAPMPAPNRRAPGRPKVTKRRGSGARKLRPAARRSR